MLNSTLRVAANRYKIDGLVRRDRDFCSFARRALRC
jgi:hypothetical protein